MKHALIKAGNEMVDYEFDKVQKSPAAEDGAFETERIQRQARQAVQF